MKQLSDRNSDYNMLSMTDTQVTRFYAGKTILVTGSTGLVGKVLLEKLLYSVPNVSRIYVLVREKRGVTVGERIEQLIKSPVFAGPDRILGNVFREKIVPIYGDLTKPGLGLSDHHRTLIVDKVNIVFHCAANVRFNSPLKVALQANFLGTKMVADLCREIQQLEAFVHVSTCFSNCHKSDIEEKVYSTKMTGQQLIKMSSSMSDDQLDKFAEDNDLYEGRPNSYVLVKALAENYVANTCQGLPVAIARLPGVVPPLSEPEPSFTDTGTAFNFVVVNTFLGTTRSYRYDPKCRFQVLPIDHVVNGLILIAHQTSLTKSTHVRVYNMTPGDASKATVGAFMAMSRSAAEKALSYHRRRPVPDVARPSGPIGHAYKSYILEFFYAYLVDLTYAMTGRKASAYQEISRISDVRDSIEYFLLHSPTFRNENYRSLSHLQDPEDGAMFNVRIEDVTRVINSRKNSFAYTSSCVTSYMKYKLKETVTPQSVAERKKYLHMLHYKELFSWTMIHAILCLLAYLFYCTTSIAFDLLFKF